MDILWRESRTRVPFVNDFIALHVSKCECNNDNKADEALRLRSGLRPRTSASAMQWSTPLKHEGSRRRSHSLAYFYRNFS